VSQSALHRQLRRSLGPSIAERARVAAPAVDRYRRDPFAHLDDGHVLILGLARDETPDEDVVVSDEGAVRLAPQVFTPYEYEREIGAAWIDLERLRATGELVWVNGLGEKSRQMGWTWTTSWLLLWGLMYFPETRSLAIHLNLSKVDDGGDRSTTESIFGRIRYMAESKIPQSWGLPQESTWPESMRPIDYLTFRQAPTSSIVNRLTGATLVGGSATEDPGRGGTYTNVLADEFARVPWGGAAHRSLRSACPRGRLYGSTPHGKSNRFYQLVSKPPRGYRKIRLHWSRHPIYGDGAHIAGDDPEGCIRCAGTVAGVKWDPETTAHLCHRYPGRVASPWYDTAVTDLTDEDVAQELDISYEASQTARVYPMFDPDVHVVDTIDYDPSLPIEFSFDYGFSPSLTSVGIWQDGPDVLRKIGEVEVAEKTPDQVAALIRSALLDLGVEPINTEPRFTRRMLAVGDPSGEARTTATGRSIVFEYSQQGFTILSRQRPVRDTIRAMQRLLLGRPKPVRYSARGCPRTILHMQENRWPTDRSGAVKLDASEPVHDEHSHMTSADRYYVRWKYEPPRVEDALAVATASGGTDGLPYRRLDEWEAAQLSGTGRLDESIGPDMRL
jgi:hypothetical protein